MIAIAEADIYSDVLQSFKDTAEYFLLYILLSAPHPICSLPFSESYLHQF